MASSSPFAHDSQNPFLVSGQASVFAPVAASDSEQEATGGYAMIKSAPAVDASEVVSAGPAPTREFGLVLLLRAASGAPCDAEGLIQVDSVDVKPLP